MSLADQAYEAIWQAHRHNDASTSEQYTAWEVAIRNDRDLVRSIVTVYSLSGVQATYEYLTAYMERNNEQA